MVRLLFVLILCLFSPLIFATRANAYIDPATGSMIIQAVLAAIAAAAVSIGIFWRRVKLFVASILGRKKDEEP